MPDDPPCFPIKTKQYDTIPIVFDFDDDVTGVPFRFSHSTWGDIPITGDGLQASIPISEAMGALVPGEYGFTLIANDGVEGSEHVCAEGPHIHSSRRVDRA